MHHWMVELKAVQVPRLAQDRHNAQCSPHMICLQQGWIRIRTRSINRDSIEVYTQVRKMDCEILQLHTYAQAFAGLRLRGTNHVVVKPYIVQQDRNANGNDQRRSEEHTSELQSPCNLV